MSESPWLLKSGSAYREGLEEPDVVETAHDLLARSPKYDGHAPHAAESQATPAGSTE